MYYYILTSEKYVRSTCYFFPPPPPFQFSKILLKWGRGKAKKYCTVTFLRPPPNRVTKGGVMLLAIDHWLPCLQGSLLRQEKLHLLKLTASGNPLKIS